MAVPAIKYTVHVGLKDHAGKDSHAFWQVPEADYAAYVADYTTGTIRDMIDDYMQLTLDLKVSEEVNQINFQIIAPAPVPTDENAVNSAKLLVLGRDTITGKAFKQEIPARNGANYTSVKGTVDITSSGHPKTYVTARNATALSEDNNATVVTEMRVIGKGTQA